MKTIRRGIPIGNRDLLTGHYIDYETGEIVGSPLSPKAPPPPPSVPSPIPDGAGEPDPPLASSTADSFPIRFAPDESPS